MGDRPTDHRGDVCHCDYNPATTQGPEEDCPVHGRRYSEWVERGDVLQRRIDAARDLILEWTNATCQTDGAPCSWHRVAAVCAAELRVALEMTP